MANIYKNAKFDLTTTDVTDIYKLHLTLEL